MKKSIFWVAMVLSTLPGLASASRWNINSEKTVIDFNVANMKVMTVKGIFKNVKGEVILDETNMNKSSVLAEVDASTVNTGNGKRDEHLISADFLDVATHNKMKFTSTRLVVEEGRLKIHGNLTIRGITKNTVLDAGLVEEIEKKMKGAAHCSITATTDINRIDFGVDNNRFLTYGIGNKVYITLIVELDKAE